MKFRSALLALTAIPALYAQAPPPSIAAPAAPTDPNKVVLSIGKEKLTAAQFDALVEALPAQYQQYAKTQKRQFAESIVQLKLLAQGAEAAGIDKTPKVQDQIKFSRENLLAQAMFENVQQTVKVDDSLVQLYYDAHKNEYESVKAKHILIRMKGAPMPAAEGKAEITEEQALAKAKELVAKLKAGGDFTALAKAESDDTGSATQGGDLGEFHRGMMVPPFEEAAFAQKVGEVGEPVKSPFGYHIIVVQAHSLRALADARAEIEAKLRPEMAKKEVESLRSKATVTIDDGFFGPEVPAAPPAVPNPHK